MRRALVPWLMAQHGKKKLVEELTETVMEVLEETQAPEISPVAVVETTEPVVKPVYVDPEPVVAEIEKVAEVVGVDPMPVPVPQVEVPPPAFRVDVDGRYLEFEDLVVVAELVRFIKAVGRSAARAMSCHEIALVARIACS